MKLPTAVLRFGLVAIILSVSPISSAEAKQITWTCTYKDLYGTSRILIITYNIPGAYAQNWYDLNADMFVAYADHNYYGGITARQYYPGDDPSLGLRRVEVRRDMRLVAVIDSGGEVTIKTGETDMKGKCEQSGLYSPW